MTKITTKRGAVSIYAVVFLTLVFGIITLSFTRIIIGESIITVNTDLSKSAYDSAMAGVEDAKIAILKYHDCLSQGYTPNANSNVGSCQRIIYEMQKGIAESSCDVVTNTLGRETGDRGETIVQETQSKSNNGSASYMEQAYTCVKITEETDDYLTTLTNADSTRIIPLRSADLSQVNAIQFSWYSTANAGVDGEKYMIGGSDSNTTLKDNSEKYAPPIIALEIFQTDSSGGVPDFNVAELNVNNYNSRGTDHAMLIFEPRKGNAKNFVSKDSVYDHSDKYNNDMIQTQCNATSSPNGFACTVTIELPDTYRHTPRVSATTFLKVNLPYKRPNTDISVALCKSVNDNACSGYTTLTGVQAAVDSTGRANDLYRRIETRIELVDLYYPYPEYALHLSGNDASDKNFYVTRNCWKSDKSGGAQGCANSGWVSD